MTTLAGTLFTPKKTITDGTGYKPLKDTDSLGSSLEGHSSLKTMVKDAEDQLDQSILQLESSPQARSRRARATLASAGGDDSSQGSWGSYQGATLPPCTFTAHGDMTMQWNYRASSYYEGRYEPTQSVPHDFGGYIAEHSKISQVTILDGDDRKPRAMKTHVKSSKKKASKSVEHSTTKLAQLLPPATSNPLESSVA